MQPVLSTQSQEGGYLRFTLKGVNVSLANAIRRTIISEVPTVVFRTSPHESNLAQIDTNTTRMNNELLKHRLSCIPIHITDTAFPINDYVVDIYRRNDSEMIEYVTTGDFRVRDTKTDRYLSDAEIHRIFPASPITGDYIDFARLRPRISDDIPGEELRLTCGFSIGTAKEDGAFNVASTCSYAATPDSIKSNAALSVRLKELKGAGTEADELERIKRDWTALEAKRFIKPDSFDFLLESVGVFSNTALVLKACHVIIDKFRLFQDVIQADDALIVPTKSTIENCFDVTLNNEDYTLGKVLEFILYSTHFGKTLTYCGFNKPHPHHPVSYVRLGFKNPTQVAEVISYLINAAATAIVAFEKIASEFEE